MSALKSLRNRSSAFAWPGQIQDFQLPTRSYHQVLRFDVAVNKRRAA